jgi:hypothetical protein
MYRTQFTETIMVSLPKYSILEIERKWLVQAAFLGSLEGKPYREIEDLYITGARLRLRKISAADGTAEYKFGKKYGRSSHLSEPITNLYLSESEFSLLRALNGNTVLKHRYQIAGGSLDLYLQPAGVAVFEREFASEEEALAYTPPQFVETEVTNDPSLSGAELASRAGRSLVD